jgi:aspartyl-tRNA(Asn)/glutamyl-tRNA(Gln) amidotransferase subunit C
MIPPMSGREDTNAPAAHAIAALARIALEPEEQARLEASLGRIVEAFAALSAVDVEGVAPMTCPTDAVDVLREDRPRPSLDRDAVLDRAPRREGDFFGVPKTIGGPG